MKLVKLTDLRHGDVFLTKSSKLYIFGWAENDGTIIACRYSNKLCLDVLNANTSVYLMENL